MTCEEFSLEVMLLYVRPAVSQKKSPFIRADIENTCQDQEERVEILGILRQPAPLLIHHVDPGPL